MSRLVSLIRCSARPTIFNKVAFNAKTIVAPMTINVFKSFCSGSKDEPFLDSKEVSDRIVEVVMNFDKIKKANVSAVARFKEDLDLDSLDAVEIVMLIEEEFSIEIPDQEADKILSVADAISYVSSHPMAK